MATVNGTNYAKSIDPSANNIVDPGLLGGRLRVITDTYEAAALASGSVIRLGKQLPTGAVVCGYVLGYDSLNATVESTITLGDEGDADRYLTSTTVSVAGVKTAFSVVDGMNYAVTGTTDNIIRITTGVSTCTGTIKLALYYTTD